MGERKMRAFDSSTDSAENPLLTGRIISFESRRNCEQASSRRICLQINRPSSPIRSQTAFVPVGPSTRTRILKLQVARIARLLDELEELARTTDNLPPAIDGQRHAGIERGHGILQACSGSEREAGCEDGIEGDPQPDIDGEMLARMYRELDPDA
jgi:hypothetical protein